MFALTFTPVQQWAGRGQSSFAASTAAIATPFRMGGKGTVL